MQWVQWHQFVILIKGRSCFNTYQSNTSSQSEGWVGEKNVVAWDHFEEGQKRKKAIVLADFLSLQLWLLSFWSVFVNLAASVRDREHITSVQLCFVSWQMLKSIFACSLASFSQVWGVSVHAFHSCLTHITDKQESKVSKLKVKTSYRPQIYICVCMWVCVCVCTLQA